MTWTWTWDPDWRLLGGPYDEALFDAGVVTSPTAVKQGSWESPGQPRASMLQFKVQNLEEYDQVNDIGDVVRIQGQKLFNGITQQPDLEADPELYDDQDTIIPTSEYEIVKIQGSSIPELHFPNQSSVGNGDTVRFSYQTWSSSPVLQGYYRINVNLLRQLASGDQAGYDVERYTRVVNESAWRGTCMVCLETYSDPSADSHLGSCWVGQERDRLGLGV